MSAYLQGLDAESFDLDAYLAAQDAELLDTAEGRRLLTRLDPLLFAVVYLRHHLKGDDGEITFGDAHLDWCRDARAWVRPPAAPAEQRDAYIAPRNTGKSTWWFLILPMWAAAHGHIRFAAAFAASATQAETHLATAKAELDTNQVLRRDYPDLCTPARRPSGNSVADTQNMYVAKSGFVFAARGMDSSSLGMKVRERRPDLLLLDDIEPDESSYSEGLAAKRLTTLLDAILPLNVYARVVICGTVTMPGSIIHQLVRHARGVETADWIAEEGIRAHYSAPIVERPDGTERSMWLAKWPLSYLLEIRHTRSFRKNYLNDPMAMDSDYWSESDFTYGTFPTARTYLSVDGAVTTKKTSDYTGLSVVSYAPAIPAQGEQRAMPARCLVKFAQAVKLKGRPLRARALQILESFPEIGAVLVEGNQGQDLWEDVFHDLPVKVIIFSNSIPKEVRAEKLLNLYQLVPPRVVHAEPLAALEEQMVGFPKMPNDDLVDSVGNPVLRFLRPPARKQAAARSVQPR